MIDISKAKWEFSPEDNYIFRWLDENGFDAILEKQGINSMRVMVSKDGVKDNAVFASGRKFDVKSYMEAYRKTFEMLCKMQGGR